MSLNLIIGRSNTGKSEYLYKEIMACENENKQAILFVPPDSRIVAETEYLKYTNKKSIIGTKIISIERYVSNNIDKYVLYKDKTYLKDMSKKILVKKVISENPDIFKIFSKVKDTNGFVDKVSDYVLKLRQLDSTEILDKYENDDFLKSKLSEFINVYDLLNDTLKERFVTSTDELDYFIKNLKKTDGSTKIYIDNYNNFNDKEYELIQNLLLNNYDVTITLDICKEKYLNGESNIWDNSYDTLAKLKCICEKNGVSFKVVNLEKQKNNKPEDLMFLSENIFCIEDNKFNKKVDNVSLIIKPNSYDEIKYVAESITNEIKNGKSFKDIVIYTNNLDEYYLIIKKVFEQFKIPVYINKKENITGQNIVIYILTLLKLVLNGFSKSTEEILNLLKTGYVIANKEGVYTFENYIQEFGIRGYNFNDEFILNTEYDLEKINEIRIKIVDVVKTLKQTLKGKKTSKEITKCLCEFLNENVIENYQNELLAIMNIDINEFNIKKQTLAKIYEVMDSIIIAIENITLKEYVEMLEYGISQIKLDTIPSKIDQVEVLDINQNRGTEKKVGCVLGCYDQGLPMMQTEDNIFTDKELIKLKQNNIDLKQTSEERNNMQLFNIYQAISKIREKIIFTIPASSLAGASYRPSSIINDIKDMLNICVINEDKSSNNKYEMFMDFLTDCYEITDNESKEKIKDLWIKYNLFKEDKDFLNIMNYVRKDSNLDKKTLDNIYKEYTNSSVSKLEQFTRCPFAYYTKYVLNVKENKEYKMSNMDMGSLMHEVIEKFSKFIVSKNISWQDIVTKGEIKQLAKEKVTEIVDNIFYEKYSKYLSASKYVVLKKRLNNSMIKTILAIAESFNHSEFRPLGYEIEFEKDSLFLPIEIELDSGKKILLRGKIDRIDSLNENGNTYLRIVDYKSTDKNLKLSDVKSGISLQLMTYMWAMLENKDKIDKENNVIPAALSYFTISSKLLNISNYEKDESKVEEKLVKALKHRGIYIKDVQILKKLDNNFENSSKSYLEVSSRTINNIDKVLPESVFKEECNNVKNILKGIGEEITKGNVEICPNKKIDNVCEYCSYNTICRKDILN